MDSASATGIVQSAGEARPPTFVERESELGESPGDEDETGFLVQSKWHESVPFLLQSMSMEPGHLQCHDRVRTRSFFR